VTNTESPFALPLLDTVTFSIRSIIMTKKRKNDTSFEKEPVGIEKDSFPDHTLLPPGIRKRLYEVDWSIKDVLVGSLGSVQQLQDNLKRNYYYVSAKYVSETALPIRYVSIFQSKTLFGNNAGIRYYGKVIQTKLIPRKQIDFPLRRNNGDELYYAFGIEEWKTLPATIGIKYDIVREPRFTNKLLLDLAGQSYELFNIMSSEHFILLHKLKQALPSIAFTDNILPEKVIRLESGKAIWIHDGIIDAVDENGNRMLDAPFAVADFAKNPKQVFCTLAEKLI